jgi:hypothetical protein
MKVEVLRAWPQRFECVELELPEGSLVRDALKAVEWGDDPETVAYAVFGARVAADSPLREGDRVELLRPLQADPKDARRRRAHARSKP